MLTVKASMTFNWRGDALAKVAREAFAIRLRKVAEELRQKVADNVSGPSPSAPGDFPGTITGDLKRSISADVDDATLSVTVGSLLEYALLLEYGTAKMAARPFLRRTLLESGGWLRAALEAPLDLPEVL